MKDLEAKFVFLFDQIGLRDSANLAKEYIQLVPIGKEPPESFKTMLGDSSAYAKLHGAQEDEPGAD